MAPLKPSGSKTGLSMECMHTVSTTFRDTPLFGDERLCITSLIYSAIVPGNFWQYSTDDEAVGLRGYSNLIFVSLGS
jgi:hypothetical protein